MPIGVYLRPPISERFWAKVRVIANGCWEWTGAKTEGYGRLWDNGRRAMAHRLAFQWANGAIPNGMTLDHLCRNHACVNPDHLEIVTRKENILRGISFTAIHSRAKKCPQGHPYDMINTYVTPVGGRACKICMREAHKRWKTRQTKN